MVANLAKRAVNERDVGCTCHARRDRAGSAGRGYANNICRGAGRTVGYYSTAQGTLQFPLGRRDVHVLACAQDHHYLV